MSMQSSDAVSGPLSGRAFASICRRYGTLSVVSHHFLALHVQPCDVFVPGYWGLTSMSAMFGDLVNWLEHWQWSCIA